MTEQRAGEDRRGRKDDQGKPRWDLVWWPAVDSLVARLTHGVQKYAAHNWKFVREDNGDVPRERYFAAMMRHVSGWRSGELIDKESGLNHLSGVIFNAMCLMWFDEAPDSPDPHPDSEGMVRDGLDK